MVTSPRYDEGYFMNLDRILPVAAPLLKRALHPKQKAREVQFASVPRSPGRVVFLGDSITEWTAWEDWFPELQTSNRGIGGQAISDVKARLDSAIVAPVAISVLVGTNDLHGLGKSSNVDAIVDQMRELIGDICTRAPATSIFINSIMPRSTHFRDRIVAVNKGYSRIAAESGATFIDLWPIFAGSDGAILPVMTADGLHLSIAGYTAWVEVLRPHLAPFAA